MFMLSIIAHLASCVSCRTREDKEQSVVLVGSNLSDKFKKTNKSK